MSYKTWWLLIHFVTLSKEEDDVCQDLCLFLCTSTSEESSHVYVCQIFSGSSLVLTAYSLASVPTKLKTCSCTSWHALSHSSPPPFISPLSHPHRYFSLFCLNQKHIVTKPDQVPWRDQILRHSYKHVVCALTLSSWFQTTNTEFLRPAIALISLISSIPKTSHHLCKEDSNINQDKSRVLEYRFIVTSDLET